MSSAARKAALLAAIGLTAIGGAGSIPLALAADTDAASGREPRTTPGPEAAAAPSASDSGTAAPVAEATPDLRPTRAEDEAVPASADDSRTATAEALPPADAAGSGDAAAATPTEVATVPTDPSAAEPSKIPASLDATSPKEPDGAIEGAPVASPPVAAPEPAPTQAAVPADPLSAAIAERLSDRARALSPRLGRKDHDALAAFYAGSGYRPVWIRDGGWTEPARSIVARIAAAREDGLNPTDYPNPVLQEGKPEATVADLAEAELKLSTAAVLYARDARGGRIDPSRLSKLITPKLDLPAADAVLRKLAEAGGEAGAALAAYNPQQAGYLALKAKLAELRAARPSASLASVPHGPMLKVGMRDPRVPLIRARLGLGPAPDQTTYDERLASAVAAFQREKRLVPSGVLTRQTVVALSPPRMSAASEADLVANMERWRWLPADLGDSYIAVNIPEFRARVVDGGHVAHQTRVIVGKPETPTPVFSANMEYAIVNPSWNVPPSILKNEFLPKMAKDPLYAARLGYEVVRRGNSIAIRQPPGERNALGHIKFMFPNDHAVYLHDTPNRSLFSAARRTFSHGCVRVDEPMKLAEVLLGPKWTAARVRSLIGRGERTISLARHLPVHITYFTTFVDEAGNLRSAEDVYGYNRRVRAALGYQG